MKKLAQGFSTAAGDSNLGSRSRESKPLPLSHCALLNAAYAYYLYYVAALGVAVGHLMAMAIEVALLIIVVATIVVAVGHPCRTDGAICVAG